MPDYNLTGLSTRSFEQLVQALAAKIIGPNIVIFGEGRDGGREATFEGFIPYPTKENGWSGYGVFQAKFKQRTQDTKIDGDWAIEQLRKELEDFADPDKGRRKPEYYIFATNIILTPFPDKGSKDKVAEVFKEYETSVPLKGYDVWDYDKICRFLDDNEDIRRSYAAWITPGDVLSQVIDWIKPQKPDFEKILSRYLQEELLSDQYANLERARHRNDKPIPIANVFIDLPTSDNYLVEPSKEEKESTEFLPGFIAQMLESAASRLNPQSLIANAKPEDLAEQIRQPMYGRFVLIGGPGQGKTTVGQFICQLFRASILKEKMNSLEDDVRQALSTILSQCEYENFQLPTARRFPIRVVLSDFARQLATQKEGDNLSLLSYVVNRIRKQTDRDISLDDFRSWLQHYPWFLILDGLDEVPLSSNREQVLEAIRSFRIEARDCDADLMIIATTRPQGYSDDFSPKIYKHLYLSPLTTKRALHYGQRLVEARYPNDKDRREKVMLRLERASRQETMARLMRSPLQVTIMTTLVDRMGQPPQERWNLFREYYNVIYQREVEREIPASDILREYRTHVDAIHHRVGLLLQIESESTGQTDARISKESFAAIVKTRLTEQGFDEDDIRKLSEQIINAASYRLVFLVGLEADRIGFEIRSLQEFMAAEALMSGNDDEVRNRLREIAPISNWRNVFLFAASKCIAERESLLDTIQSICIELNEEETDNVLKFTLSGSQLALDLLEDLPVQLRPKYARVLARVALRLLDYPPDELHVKLAELYNEKLKTVYEEEIETRLNLANFHHRLGAWSCLLKLIDVDVTWAWDLANQYWQHELEEELTLLELNNEIDGRKFISNKISEIIPRHNPLELNILLGRFNNDFLEIQETIPAWFASAWTIIKTGFGSSGKLEIPYTSPNNKRTMFLAINSIFYNSSLDDERERFENLAEMDNPSPGWKILIDAIPFVISPKAESLGIVLANLAETDDFHLIKSFAEGFPWPLGSCIKAATNKEDLHNFSEKAASGLLGNSYHWDAAEERWKKEGVLKEDFIVMDEKKLPLDESVCNQGIPLSARLVIQAHLGNLESDVALLHEILPINSQVKSFEIRGTLSGVIQKILSNIIIKSKSQLFPIKREEYETIIEDFRRSQERFDIAGLMFVEWKEQETKDWVDIWDKIGKLQNLDFLNMNKIRMVGLSLALNLFNRLSNFKNQILQFAECYIEHPEKTGILRLLSLFAMVGYKNNLPSELLQYDKYDDPIIKEAVLTLKLIPFDLCDDEVDISVSRIIALLPENKSFVSKLPSLIKKMPENEIAFALLSELHTRLPFTYWQTHQVILSALNNSIRQRKSSMRDLQVLEKLKLKEGLRDVLLNPE